MNWHSCLDKALLKKGDISIIPMVNNGILFPLVEHLQWKPGVVAQVLAGRLQDLFPFGQIVLPRLHYSIQIRIVYPSSGDEFKV